MRWRQATPPSGWPRRAPVRKSHAVDRCSLGRYDEALTCADSALRAAPSDFDALCFRAGVLTALCEREGALAAFDAALAINPRDAAVRLERAIAAIPIIPEDSAVVERARIEFGESLQDVARRHPASQVDDATAMVGVNTPFYLAYQPLDNRALQIAHGRLCADLMGEWGRRRGFAAPQRADAPTHRIRIGIASAFVCNHSVFHALVKGWLSRINRDRFELSIFNLSAVEVGALHRGLAAARAVAPRHRYPACRPVALPGNRHGEARAATRQSASRTDTARFLGPSADERTADHRSFLVRQWIGAARRRRALQ
jgi:tetratricopeptide (TPR) repeat protein